MKESITCQTCKTNYTVEWIEDEDDIYSDNYFVPDYCPFCGSRHVEVDDDNFD